MQNVIAITQSGKHIEAKNCAIGSTKIQTPFGIHLSIGDPVSIIRDQAESLEILSQIKEKKDLNKREWLNLLLESGQNSFLINECERFWRENNQCTIGVEILKEWSLTVNSIPEELETNQYTEWLYQEMLRAKGFLKIVYGIQLVNNVSTSGLKRIERNLTTNQLLTELKSNEAVRRMIASMVIEKQSEIMFINDLISLSINDPIGFVRQQAAQDAVGLHRNTTLTHWTKLALRGEHHYRSHAIELLNNYGGEEGENVLKILSQTIGKKIGDRFQLNGKSISIVATPKKGLNNLQRLHFDKIRASSNQDFTLFLTNEKFLETTSTIKVTSLPVEFGEKLLSLL